MLKWELQDDKGATILEEDKHVHISVVNAPITIIDGGFTPEEILEIYEKAVYYNERKKENND